ncbi:MAG: hypothetical protein K1X52_09935 [Pyrinomonadaceae bacterium]|nr:hypothetical protein [Pyrinomonadaceae bacterium]
MKLCFNVEDSLSFFLSGFAHLFAVKLASPSKSHSFSPGFARLFAVKLCFNVEDSLSFFLSGFARLFAVKLCFTGSGSFLILGGLASDGGKAA